MKRPPPNVLRAAARYDRSTTQAYTRKHHDTEFSSPPVWKKGWLHPKTFKVMVARVQLACDKASYPFADLWRWRYERRLAKILKR